MKANQAAWPARAVCRVLGLSPSGYYAWARRRPSARARRDGQLLERIKAIWTANRAVYGRPRIHAELQACGERVSAVGSHIISPVDSRNKSRGEARDFPGTSVR